MPHNGTEDLENSTHKMRMLLSDAEHALAESQMFTAVTHELAIRRTFDLSDLPPEEQYERIASGVSHVITPERLKELLAQGRPMRVKFGIDPTGFDVHLGHAVPIMLAGRLQRMGHHVIIIIGDVTAKIGDPSGRTKERPPLTDEDIARNLETYKEQMSPFIDFDKAELRKNSEWLLNITTPELLSLLGRIPLSMQLQREDFRKRLEAGHSLSTAELLYSIYMAYDSVAIEADLEIGGVDQLLNMQMCRKIMEVRELIPEVILTTNIIEGTDGSGEKMSKSKGNYVGLNETPEQIYGKVMSIPDRLITEYFKAVTEMTTAEIELLTAGMGAGRINPMTAKHVLAFDIVSVVHSLEDAQRAHEQFIAQFSKRSLTELADIPTISREQTEKVVADVLLQLAFVDSKSDARRTADAGGVQLVAEGKTADILKLTSDQVLKETLANTLETFRAGKESDTAYFLKIGRSVARIV
jgi:tyrosyl-tRNA synthetase